jgi:hypothetical protein
MAIGLGVLRAAGRRAGRAEKSRTPERSTVREVCLIGLDRRDSAGDWATGQEVTWLGRRYQVRAMAVDAPGPSLTAAGGTDSGPSGAPARQYVHLSPSDGT